MENGNADGDTRGHPTEGDPIVGAPFGSDQANEDVAPVQSKVVEALGLSHLEKVA